MWFAFWGAVKSRPAYRKICDERDQYYDDVVEGLCQEIIADGGYQNVSASSVTIALTSITNGMWLSFLISPKNFDRQENLDAIVDLLRRYFPRHYA